MAGVLLLSSGFLLGRNTRNPTQQATLSPTPVKQTLGAREENRPKGLEQEFLVTKVVDGDTIQIETGKTVRYIGIDTPETSDPRRGIECFGKEAAAKNRELLERKEVRLEKDVSETDRYGRLLRYVFVDGIFVNDELVRQGFAHASAYPPDVVYQDQFREAEKQARENNRGLWASCGVQKESSAESVSSSQVNAVQEEKVEAVGEDRDCGDFRTHDEAQSFFLSQGGPSVDPHKLDQDQDGIACETLP